MLKLFIRNLKIIDLGLQLYLPGVGQFRCMWYSQLFGTIDSVHTSTEVLGFIMSHEILPVVRHGIAGSTCRKFSTQDGVCFNMMMSYQYGDFHNR